MNGLLRSAATRDWSLLLGWCAGIFIFSHQPTVPVPLVFPYADKLYHFLTYGVLGWLAWQAFSHRLQGKQLLLLSIAFCSLYGVSDECHQSFIEGRYSEVGDWLADTAGAFVVAVVRYLRGR